MICIFLEMVRWPAQTSKLRPVTTLFPEFRLHAVRAQHSALLVAFLGLLFNTCLYSAGRAEPPPDRNWEPIPELTDEFDGNTLDSGKWYDTNPGWKGRQPGLFSPKNVTVSDGKLQLTSRAEDLPDLPQGYNTFTTAAVKSKSLVKYGYFEVKCRPMKSKASSAFWFYHSTKELWTEIDVFEICGVGNQWTNAYNMNAHVFRSPGVTNHFSNGGKWEASFNLAEDYHVYALLWDEKKIQWLVDGRLVRDIENTHWHQPLSLNFDSETMPEWFGLPDKRDLPSTFSIEYVRSWKLQQNSGQAPSTNGSHPPDSRHN